MHSSVVRVQNCFGFLTTVAFLLAIITATSVVVSRQDPNARVQPVLRSLQVVKGRPNYYTTKKQEYAHIRFDLDADLSSLFNWNTKQLFVWITATWSAHENGIAESRPSQAIIWDTIIEPHSDTHHQSSLVALKYYLSSALGSAKPGKAVHSARKPRHTAPHRGVLHLKNTKPKYQITDVNGIISEQRNVTLELGWNVQPCVGALAWTVRTDRFGGMWRGLDGGISSSFDMPSIKGKTSTVPRERNVVSTDSPIPAGASAII